LLALHDKKITLITVVPTILQSLLNSPQWSVNRFEHLRIMSIGSTDVPTSLINKVQAEGIPVLQVYGATETSPLAIYQRLEDKDQVGSIGKAGSLCEVRLTDERGKEVAVGESGQIEVKGENILQAYWKNEEDTQSSIVDGWFKTGDVAHKDSNGYYWFSRR